MLDEVVQPETFCGFLCGFWKTICLTEETLEDVDGFDGLWKVDRENSWAIRSQVARKYQDYGPHWVGDGKLPNMSSMEIQFSSPFPVILPSDLDLGNRIDTLIHPTYVKAKLCYELNS